MSFFLLPNHSIHGLRKLAAGMAATAVALVVLQLAWEAWLAPTGQRTLALKALPWVLAWVGLARGHLYTARWVSLMVWLYVMESAVRVYSDAGVSAWCAALQGLLCMVLFVQCVLRVRLHESALRIARG